MQRGGESLEINVDEQFPQVRICLTERLVVLGLRFCVGLCGSRVLHFRSDMRFGRGWHHYLRLPVQSTSSRVSLTLSALLW